MADVAIHTPSRAGDERNHHAHIMLTTRKAELGADNRLVLTEKIDLELSNAKRKELGLQSSSKEIISIRQDWEQVANAHLERAGIAERIDHRSHKELENGKIPQIHETPQVTAMRRKGIETEISRANDKRRAYNVQIDQQNALETLRSDFKGVVRGQVGESVQNALERPLSRLQGHSENLQGVVRDIERAKRDLDWRANLWYFGGFAVFMACCMGFLLWFVPSLDEIGERRAELAHLTAQIEKAQNLQRLQTSNCDKRLCVKVIESKCNYGSKGDRYCVVELK